MLTPETNAKKIETLSRIAKLLRDQVQEQNEKIIMLQKDMESLRSQITQLSQLKIKDSYETELKKDIDPLPIPPTKQEAMEENISISQFNNSVIEKETTISINQPPTARNDEDRDKKDLLQALKIIDNL